MICGLTKSTLRSSTHALTWVTQTKQTNAKTKSPNSTFHMNYAVLLCITKSRPLQLYPNSQGVHSMRATIWLKLTNCLACAVWQTRKKKMVDALFTPRAILLQIINHNFVIITTLTTLTEGNMSRGWIDTFGWRLHKNRTVCSDSSSFHSPICQIRSQLKALSSD